MWSGLTLVRANLTRLISPPNSTTGGCPRIVIGNFGTNWSHLGALNDILYRTDSFKLFIDILQNLHVFNDILARIATDPCQNTFTKLSNYEATVWTSRLRYKKFSHTVRARRVIKYLLQVHIWRLQFCTEFIPINYLSSISNSFNHQFSTDLHSRSVVSTGLYFIWNVFLYIS